MRPYTVRGRFQSGLIVHFGEYDETPTRHGQANGRDAGKHAENVQDYGCKESAGARATHASTSGDNAPV